MRSRGNIRQAVCILAGLGIFVGGGQAAAQSDGVVVDPDSPAGKEYALPLDKARADAAPDRSGAPTTGSDAAPLFGAGITKRNGPQSGGGGKGGGGEGGQPGSDGQGDGRDGAEDAGRSVAESVTAAAGASGSGLSSAWLTALVALGVLLVGGIVGVSLRALRSTEGD